MIAQVAESTDLRLQEHFIAFGGAAQEAPDCNLAISIGRSHIEIVQAHLEREAEVLVVLGADGISAGDDFGDHQVGAAEAAIGHPRLLVAPLGIRGLDLLRGSRQVHSWLWSG